MLKQRTIQQRAEEVGFLLGLKIQNLGMYNEKNHSLLVDLLAEHYEKNSDLNDQAIYDLILTDFLLQQP